MSGLEPKRRRASADPNRIAELRQKIHQRGYLEGAIDRIARVLTEEIVQANSGVYTYEQNWEMERLKA